MCEVGNWKCMKDSINTHDNMFIALNKNTDEKN